eukprot:4006595-Pyramimonas_sp.AAC.1
MREINLEAITQSTAVAKAKEHCAPKQYHQARNAITMVIWLITIDPPQLRTTGAVGTDHAESRATPLE